MYKKLSRITKLIILPPSALYWLLSVGISRGSAISIRPRISPTFGGAKVATNELKHSPGSGWSWPASCYQLWRGWICLHTCLSGESSLELSASWPYEAKNKQISNAIDVFRFYQRTEENGSVFWLEVAGVLARGCCLRSLFSNSVSIVRTPTNH